jgi:hypothetical protein
VCALSDAHPLLLSLVAISDIHANRLEKALAHTTHLLPFNPTCLQRLTDDELGYLEMLTSRFAKLQDSLGAKIFPLLLQLLQESRSDESALDRLYKLEKLGILPSANNWIAMRELRNAITHEYPDNPELMAANLNKTAECARQLLAFWQTLKECMRERGFILLAQDCPGG